MQSQYRAMHIVHRAVMMTLNDLDRERDDKVYVTFKYLQYIVHSTVTSDETHAAAASIARFLREI